MRKIWFIVFSIFFIINLQGQNLKKIALLYQHGEYKKCIEKTQKARNKYPHSPYLLYYEGFCYFQQFKTVKPYSKKFYLNKTLLRIEKGLRYDTSKTVFEEFSGDFNDLHDTLVEFSKRLYPNDKKSAERFLSAVAKIYGDTTDLYKKILEDKKPKEPTIVQDLAFREYSGEINQTDEQGRRQGVWIQKYPNGVVKSEIYFIDGHPAGIFRKYYPNGRLKADLYFDKTGTVASAILYKEDGSKFAMGYYWNRKKDSLWQYFYNDTTVLIEEHYKKGVKDGPEYIYSIYYYPNLLQEKHWKNGKLDSVFVNYYPWGIPKSMYYYKNGKREGPAYVFDENGRKITQGYYKNDLPDSVWIYIDYQKKDTTKLVYKNGELLPEYEEKMSEELKKQLQNRVPSPQELFEQEYGMYQDEY